MLKAAFPSLEPSHQPQQLSEDKSSLISLKDHPKLRDKLKSLKYGKAHQLAGLQARANSVIEQKSIVFPSLFPDVESTRNRNLYS